GPVPPASGPHPGGGTAPDQGSPEATVPEAREPEATDGPTATGGPTGTDDGEAGTSSRPDA
ncbi:MAG: hypothetical protein ACK5LN_11340, partial [Propioniciclava sp.]